MYNAHEATAKYNWTSERCVYWKCHRLLDQCDFGVDFNWFMRTPVQHQPRKKKDRNNTVLLFESKNLFVVCRNEVNWIMAFGKSKHKLHRNILPTRQLELMKSWALEFETNWFFTKTQKMHASSTIAFSFFFLFFCGGRRIYWIEN